MIIFLKALFAYDNAIGDKKQVVNTVVQMEAPPQIPFQVNGWRLYLCQALLSMVINLSKRILNPALTLIL